MIGSLKRTNKPRDGTSQAHNEEGMTILELLVVVGVFGTGVATDCSRLSTERRRARVSAGVSEHPLNRYIDCLFLKKLI